MVRIPLQIVCWRQRYGRRGLIQVVDTLPAISVRRGAGRHCRGCFEFTCADAQRRHCIGGLRSILLVLLLFVRFCVCAGFLVVGIGPSFDDVFREGLGLGDSPLWNLDRIERKDAPSRGEQRDVDDARQQEYCRTNAPEYC